MAQQQKKAAIPDTLAIQPKDSIGTDTLKPKKKRDIETTIKYSAEDSIRMDVVKKMVYLYGKAKINYGDITLESDKIEINWSNNMLCAYGGQDSTGKTLGIPVFKQGAETYTSDTIKYNFKTKKGLITKLVTKQGEGFIHGEVVKRQNDEMFVKSAHYTTCDLAHPHFYINASKLKMVPNDKIISGPFNLVISDVKTPLGFFLGMFPIPKKNKSGLIFPSYGENATRGFFLNRLGYYWAASEYLGITATTDYYSKGTFGLYLQSNYSKRYQYNGMVNFNYFKIRDNSDETFVSTTNYNIGWTHGTNQAGRSSALTATVNISSPTYYSQNSYNPASKLANDFRSNINYRKTFTGTPFSLNVNFSQSQNVVSKTMNITLPEVFFSMNRINPFKGKKSLGNKWYEQIAVQYNLNTKLAVDNSYSNYDPITNTFVQSPTGLSLSPSTIGALIDGGIKYRYGDTLSEVSHHGDLYGQKIKLNGAQFGARHQLPISTTIKLFKNFSLNPSVGLTEYWFPSKENYNMIRSSRGTDSLISRTEHGFSRAWGWSTNGTNLRTNIYGTYNFKNSNLIGIRHTITPSISYTYSPDLTSSLYGAYQDVSDGNGNRVFDRNGKPLRVSHYTKYGQLYGSPSGSESSRIGFGLINVLEAKTRNRKDTSNSTKKFKILDNFSINGSYDFLAKSFKWSDLSVAARTNVLNGRIILSYSSIYTPYSLVVDHTIPKDIYGNNSYIKVNKSFEQLNMVTSNLSASTSLNPAAFKSQQNQKQTDKDKEKKRLLQNNPEAYIDFNIPWNLSLSYYLSFTGQKYLYGKKQAISSNSLSLTGDLSLTEKTKITFNTSYDLVYKTMPSATFGIIRDLHCWQMSMTVTDFNNNLTYFFNINAKSSLLQDLKLNKRSPGLLNSVSY